MSFHCRACGRQRAGSPVDGKEVCDECRFTQMGRAAMLLAHFEALSGREWTDALEVVLDKSQNGPPDGEGDGSIGERQWAALRAVVRGARDISAALDELKIATFERAVRERRR